MPGQSIRIVAGNAHGPLVEEARRFVQAEALRGPVVVVAAEKPAADELVWASCGAVLTGIYRHTVAQLALEVARPALAAAGICAAQPLALEAIAAAAVDRLRATGKLPYFAPVATRPRFARAALDTIAELRLEGLAPARLADFAGAPAGLAALMQAFEEQLRDRGLADLAATMQAATEALAAGRHAYRGAAVVLLCPELRHKLERQLAAALAGGARAVLALAGGAEEAAQLGALLGCAAPAAPAPASTALERVQSRLFAFEAYPQTAPDDSFEMFAAAGEALECVEIARRVLRFAAGGTPFDRMAVLLRAHERYAAVLAEAFDRAGVPLWFAEGVRRPHPAGRAFLALLHFARERFPAARFLEYLSLGQAPPQRAPRDEAAIYAPAWWERLISDAAVIGGSARWKRRLDGLARELEAEENGAQAEALAALRGFVLPLIGFLERLPTSAPWGEWLHHLGELAALGIARPDGILDLLDELSPLSAIGGVALEDVLAALEGRLREYRGRDEERRHGRVYAGGVESARGLSFDVVFLPGLVEGGFPRRLVEDPLLPDDARRAVSAGLRCPGESDERKLLRCAAAAAGRRLVASYARMDLLTGRARVPSLYFFELASAAMGGAVDVRKLEESARLEVETQAGWPAPGDPAHAIDDGEYDLAVLRPALRAPENAAGLGAYLKAIDGPLASALRARWCKWDRQWRPWDGYVQKIDEEALLDPFVLSAHVYSASLLEKFAACPYRFYLAAIQGLRPAERPRAVHRMPAGLRGRIFHTAAFRYVRALLENGAPGLDAKLAMADAAVETAARELEEEVAPALAAVWSAGVDAIRRDLRSWIVAHERRWPQWRPLAAELAFGTNRGAESDPASSPDPVEIEGLVKLRGSIDLVETMPSGAIRVIDHKTGRKLRYRTGPRGERSFYDLGAVGAGETLQPLLYALAAQKLTGRLAVAAQLSYSTVRGGFEEETAAVNAATRKALADVLKGIDDAIRSGSLLAAPRPGACQHCEYQPVCGPYEEERAARKSAGAVAALDQMRGLA